LHNVAPPKLPQVKGLKIYDPTPSDSVSIQRGKIAGKRVNEYLVMGQQTGTFTLPELAFPYFDPETGDYSVAKSMPINITIEPGSGVAVASGGATPGAKNVLSEGGLRPLRVQPNFQNGGSLRGTLRGFGVLLGAPFLAWLALGFMGWARGRMTYET